jgi:hypothetical protein
MAFINEEKENKRDVKFKIKNTRCIRLIILTFNS